MKKLFHEIVRDAVIIIALLAFTWLCYVSYISRQQLDVASNTDQTAVTVDGQKITLGDMAFYILYEERKVERMAEIYNPDNTRDFWNIHTNGYFVSGQAKEAVMGMAVHDRIFYRAALSKGLVLTEEESKKLENRRTDFWEDLYPEQTKHLLTDYDSINETMKEIALAEKYQAYLADQNHTTYDAYDWDGKDYEDLLDEDHKVKINQRIWHRVFLGNITISHEKVNFINGQTDEEKEQAKEAE